MEHRGLRGAPSPTAHSSLPTSCPSTLAGLRVPSPTRGGLLSALTSLPTPTRSRKDLISCSLLGFGNYPLGREVLAMDGEVLSGQTVARCFSL